MRFMLLMIPHGYETAAPGTMPDDVEAVSAMMAYNESLQKAGVLISCDGLHPPSMGARVSFKDRKPTVVDGPFAEAKEVLGGFWVIEVDSREEAIGWAKRAPMNADEFIEVRKVHDYADWPDEVKKEIENFQGLREKAEAKR